MPFLDHFQVPLDPRRAWESFHSRWANSIADQLNERLSQRFFAQVQVGLGIQVEAEPSRTGRFGVATTTRSMRGPWCWRWGRLCRYCRWHCEGRLSCRSS
jgi:hypothetical protein